MKILELRTKEEIRTMTDPYRVDIMQVFRKYNNEPMTVKQVADVLDEPHGKVYYHMKKMLNIEALRLEKTEQINGITAKYYVLNFEQITFKKDKSQTDDSMAVNHAGMMISKMFDDAKTSLLQHVKSVNPEALLPGEDNTAVSAATLYFDGDKVEAFTQELYALIDKYKCKDDKTTFEKTFFYALYTENMRRKD